MPRRLRPYLCFIPMLVLRSWTTEATGFGDPNLEAAVRQALGKQDGVLFFQRKTVGQ